MLDTADTAPSQPRKARPSLIVLRRGPVRSRGASKEQTWHTKCKVLTERDKLVGKFSPEKLENALNSYGQQGWR